MKLSIVASLNESRLIQNEIYKKFTSIVDFLKSLLYDGIELSLLEPEKIDTNKIVEILESRDMEISALGTGSTFIRFGYSLGHHEESIRKKAIERVGEFIKFAKETNSKVIIGLIRGRYAHESNPKKERVNIESSLKECCRMAEIHDVELLFEPINSFEIDSYNTISESVNLIEKIGSDNLRLLIDSFHTYLEEDPGFIWDYLKKVAPLVSHVHLADSTRRAPGSGHFDFKTFLNTFIHAGYKGYASIETIMKPSFEEVARSSMDFLSLLLKSIK
ncbi:MAG: sugar phosphate isomerase/epimerase family protein [Promethearchaeota archaeon]